MTQKIKPTHVTFEQYESYCDLKLLQLLYDKGFRFKLETEGHRVINNLAEQRFNEGDVSYCNNYITYSVVVEWLRINHGIWVYVDWMSRTKPYNHGFYSYLRGTNMPLNKDNWIPINDTIEPGYQVFETPQKAYSAAFDYILNNLI